MTNQELVKILCVEQMKDNIAKLGQGKVLSMINGEGLILTAEQRSIYKQYFFIAVHELELEK